MSIQFRLFLGGLLLAAFAVTSFFVSQATQSTAHRHATQFFGHGLVPIVALEDAYGSVRLLESRHAIEGYAHRDGAQSSELADTLSEVLSALMTSEAALAPEGAASRKVGEIRAAVSRLRAAGGEVSERLVHRELGEISGALSQALAMVRIDAIASRDAANESFLRTERQQILGLAGLLVMLILFVWFLSAGSGAALSRAIGSLRSLGAGEPPARSPWTAPFPRLDEAIAGLGTQLAEERRRSAKANSSAATHLEEQIARLERRFEVTIDKMQEGYCLLDEKRNLVAANAPFHRLFETIAPGATAKDLQADPTLSSILSSRAPAVLVQETEDGRTLEVRRHAVSGRSTIIIVDDVTERQAANRTIERLAGTDGLTGLPNRTRFLEHLSNVLAGRNRHHDVAVLSIDIQGFGAINAAHGDAIGDAVLRATATRLSALIGPGDYLARMGPDEFAIVQADAPQPAGCTAIAEAALALAAEPLSAEEARLTLRLAVGMVHLRPRGSKAPLDAHGVLRDAEMALASVRDRKRGGQRLFSQTIRREAEERRRLESDLAEGLAAGQFELYYQPFTNVRRGAVTGFEALLRWNHPTRGLVTPGHFIPVAEETGVIEEIGAWVLAEACRAASAWPSAHAVSVNLSPIQFRSAGIVGLVRGLLAETGLAPERLQVEVTESVFLGDVEGTLEKLSALRALGVSLSMDDFGTGYSSLGYLSRFSFDKLKIDQGFVRDMGKPENAAIIRAVIGLSAAMGMGVIAEGVETREQFDALVREGCEEMQGYFFGRPEPAAQLARHIARIDGSFLDGELPRLAATAAATAANAA